MLEAPFVILLIFQGFFQIYFSDGIFPDPDAFPNRVIAFVMLNSTLSVHDLSYIRYQNLIDYLL